MPTTVWYRHNSHFFPANRVNGRHSQVFKGHDHSGRSKQSRHRNNSSTQNTGSGKQAVAGACLDGTHLFGLPLVPAEPGQHLKVDRIDLIVGFKKSYKSPPQCPGKGANGDVL